MPPNLATQKFAPTGSALILDPRHGEFERFLLTMNETIYEASQLISGGDLFKSLAPPARLCGFRRSRGPLQIADLSERRSPFKRPSRCSTSRSTLAPRNLPPALQALPAAGFIGANMTIPHKAAALATVDEADDYARKAGAVNTIVVEGEKLIGFNTDGPGLLRALREEFYVDLRDLRVLLLGAGGGAGRAIAVQCAFESCERLVLVNRTFEKAKALAQELSLIFSQ